MSNVTCLNYLIVSYVLSNEINRLEKDSAK